MSTKWGIISTAHINRLVLAGARESDLVDVLAVCSRDQSRAEEYAREWEIERAYGSYEAMLADPDVEAVYISLPNSLHVEWSIRSLEAGKHVLCEKPFDRRAVRGRARVRRGRRRGAAPLRGVHVPAQPADAPGARASRRGSDRRRQARALGVLLQARGGRERPPAPPISTAARSWTWGATASAARASWPASRRRSTASRSSASRESTCSSPGRCGSREMSSRSSTAASSRRTGTSSRSSARKGRSSSTTPGTRVCP